MQKNRKKTYSLAICYVLISLLQTGFNTIKNQDGTDSRWSDSSFPIKYYINPDGSGLNEVDTINAIVNSFNEWSTPDCTYASSQYAGRSGSKVASPSDFVNNLFFVTGKWPAELGGYGTIAVCTPASYSDGFIKDADIRFNAADFQWSTKGEIGRMDVQNIATHEIGHLWGLDHTMVFGATMYPYSSLGDTKQRTLDDDDIKGICYLYPNKNSSTRGEFGSVCEYNSECKSNICVASGDSGICSDNCEINEIGSCPSGFRCYEATDNNYYCFPGDNRSDICKPCESGKECASDLCISDGNMSVCSKFCVVESSNCPPGYYCAELTSGGGGCWPENDRCDYTDDSKDLGEVCYSLYECRSGLICVAARAGEKEGRCYYECLPERPECPEMSRCVTLMNDSGACMSYERETDAAGISDSSIPKDSSVTNSDAHSGTDIDILEDLSNLTGCECSFIEF